MMKKNLIADLLPWDEMTGAGKGTETPSAKISSSILAHIGGLGLELSAFGSGSSASSGIMTEISGAIDRELESLPSVDYYLRISVTSSVFQHLVGVLLHQAVKEKEGCRTREVLMQLAHAVMVRSMREQPFTLGLWRSVRDLSREELHPLLDELVCQVELTLMDLLGDSVYSFFEEACTREEIDTLLEKAYQAVKAAESFRQYTSRHGNGHTQLIIGYVLRWQDSNRMKRVPRITPFLRSLEAYWHHDCRLGCRQGIERMYMKRTMYA